MTKSKATDATPEPMLARTVVQNCEFIGVKYDPVTIEFLREIARATTDGFTVLGKLADVARTSGVVIDTMLKLSGD